MGRFYKNPVTEKAPILFLAFHGGSLNLFALPYAVSCLLYLTYEASQRSSPEPDPDPDPDPNSID